MKRSIVGLAVSLVLASVLVAVSSTMAGASGSSPAPSPRVVVPGGWSIVPTPNPPTAVFTDLQGVSCQGSSFCMAAGYFDDSSHQRSLVEQWNGAAWTIIPSPNTGTADENQLSGVSCVGKSFCMAVGRYFHPGITGVDQTLVEQWNGAAWTIIPSPNASTTSLSELLGVSCISTSFCIAVGDHEVGLVFQTLVEQWNGTVWTIIPSPNPSSNDSLLSVSCLGGSFCMTVGNFDNGTQNQSLVEQWNGTVWTVVTSPPNGAGVSDLLNSVSCASTTMCAAVGQTDSSAVPHVNLAMRWNGVTWSKDTVPNANASFGNALEGVSCFGPTSCVAGGWVNTIDSSGTTFVSQLLNWNGTTWVLGTVPNPPSTTPEDQINALACVPGAICVGVGFGPTGSGNIESLALSAPITRPGYYEVASDGGIFTFGGARFFGSTGSLSLNKPIVGMAATPDGGGYWLVASDGGLFAFGDAGFFGSTGALVLNKPIAGMAATPDGNGYWLVATDGGIFAFGDAVFFGSTGALVLNKPIAGMAATPDGGGYWLVASDGGIFAFGDAGFFGSTGALVLNKPIAGMAATPDGNGYWLVATDGGIFAFGDAGFFGSTGALVLNKPIVGMAATPDGRGYWLVASDGGIFTFGDAVFAGSEGGTILNKPVVGMSA